MKVIFVVPGNVSEARKGFERLIVDRILYTTIDCEFEIIELQNIFEKTKNVTSSVDIGSKCGIRKTIQVKRFKRSVIDIFFMLFRFFNFNSV